MRRVRLISVAVLEHNLGERTEQEGVRPAETQTVCPTLHQMSAVMSSFVVC